MSARIAEGGGKYDHLATYCREKAKAQGVALLVFGGDAGPGFSVQGTLPFIFSLPETLEMMAKALREQREGR